MRSSIDFSTRVLFPQIPLSGRRCRLRGSFRASDPAPAGARTATTSTYLGATTVCRRVHIGSNVVDGGTLDQKRNSFVDAPLAAPSWLRETIVMTLCQLSRTLTYSRAVDLVARFVAACRASFSSCMSRATTAETRSSMETLLSLSVFRTTGRSCAANERFLSMRPGDDDLGTNTGHR